jgi:hypothetical protein
MKTQLVGIDVSARTLNVALEGPNGLYQLEFANTQAGHRKLVRRLSKAGRSARVALIDRPDLPTVGRGGTSPVEFSAIFSRWEHVSPPRARRR